MEEKLRIYYTGQPNRKLDDEFRAVALKYGYDWVGSGYNYPEDERDLSFRREKELK